MDDNFFDGDIDWDSELKEIDLICENYELTHNKKSQTQQDFDHQSNELNYSSRNNSSIQTTKKHDSNTFIEENKGNLDHGLPASHHFHHSHAESVSKSCFMNNDNDNSNVVENEMNSNGNPFSNHSLPFNNHPVSQSSIFQAATVQVDESAAATWHYPAHKERREYQFDITQQALFSNTMVCLPTGLGKTFIASVVMLNYFRWFPKGIIIFLAPTKPLVEQQIEACINIVGIPQEATIFMTGSMPPRQRAAFWKTKKVFFVTGQTLQQDVVEHKICPIKNIVCLVVDEAHRAMGRYAYVVVVDELMKAEINFRILALTATPGKDYKTIQQVINNLRISHLEIRNELDDDVKKYIHNTNEELIKINQKESFKYVVSTLQEELSSHVSFLCSHNLFFCKNTKDVAKYTLYQANLSLKQHGFKNVRQNLIPVAEKHFANAIFLASIIETISVFGLKSALALWEDNKDGRINKDGAKLIQALNIMRREIGNGFSSPKLTTLENIMIEYYCKNKIKNENSKTIIFSSLRESVCEIIEIFKKHSSFVKAKEFIGQSKSGMFFKGQSQKEQQRILRAFKDGIYNTLVATSIGEEGLDINDVDLIVCFDVVSSLRMIQRMGRTGRKKDGHAIVLASEGKEYQKYGNDKRNHSIIARKICFNQSETFRFYDSPRMLPHKFPNPKVLFLSATPPTYANPNLEFQKCTKGKRKITNPASDPLTVSEMQVLKRRKHAFLDKKEKRYVPCLVAFPSFQTKESKFFSVGHSSVTKKMFVSAMKILRKKKGKMGMEEEWRDASNKAEESKKSFDSKSIFQVNASNHSNSANEHNEEDEAREGEGEGIGEGEGEWGSHYYSPTSIHGLDFVSIPNLSFTNQTKSMDGGLVEFTANFDECKTKRTEDEKNENNFEKKEDGNREVIGEEKERKCNISAEGNGVGEGEGDMEWKEEIEGEESEKEEAMDKKENLNPKSNLKSKSNLVIKSKSDFEVASESFSDSESGSEFISKSKSKSNDELFFSPMISKKIDFVSLNNMESKNEGDDCNITNSNSVDCFTTPPHRRNNATLSFSGADFVSCASSTKYAQNCSRTIVFQTPSPVCKGKIKRKESQTKNDQIKSNLNLESAFVTVKECEGKDKRGLNEENEGDGEENRKDCMEERGGEEGEKEYCKIYVSGGEKGRGCEQVEGKERIMQNEDEKKYELNDTNGKVSDDKNENVQIQISDDESHGEEEDRKTIDVNGNEDDKDNNSNNNEDDNDDTDTDNENKNDNQNDVNSNQCGRSKEKKKDVHIVYDSENETLMNKVIRMKGKSNKKIYKDNSNENETLMNKVIRMKGKSNKKIYGDNSNEIETLMNKVIRMKGNSNKKIYEDDRNENEHHDKNAKNSNSFNINKRKELVLANGEGEGDGGGGGGGEGEGEGDGGGGEGEGEGGGEGEEGEGGGEAVSGGRGRKDGKDNSDHHLRNKCQSIINKYQNNNDNVYGNDMNIKNKKQKVKENPSRSNYLSNNEKNRNTDYNEMSNNEDDCTQVIYIQRKKKNKNNNKSNGDDNHDDVNVDDCNYENDKFDDALQRGLVDENVNDDVELNCNDDVAENKTKKRKRLQKVGEEKQKSETQKMKKKENMNALKELIKKKKKKNNLSVSKFIDDEAEVSEDDDDMDAESSHDDRDLSDFICTADVHFINDDSLSIERRNKNYVLDNEKERKNDDMSIYRQSLLSQFPLDTTPISEKRKKDNFPKFMISPAKFGNRNKNKMRFAESGFRSFSPSKAHCPEEEGEEEKEEEEGEEGRKDRVSNRCIHDHQKEYEQKYRLDEGRECDGIMRMKYEENKENYDECLNNFTHNFTNHAKKCIVTLFHDAPNSMDGHSYRSNRDKNNSNNNNHNNNHNNNDYDLKYVTKDDSKSADRFGFGNLDSKKFKNSREEATGLVRSEPNPVVDSQEDDFFQGLDLDAMEKEMEEEYQTQSQHFQKSQLRASNSPVEEEKNRNSNAMASVERHRVLLNDGKTENEYSKRSSDYQRSNGVIVRNDGIQPHSHPNHHNHHHPIVMNPFLNKPLHDCNNKNALDEKKWNENVAPEVCLSTIVEPSFDFGLDL